MKKGTQSRKLIAVLLALALVITLVPATALAEVLAEEQEVVQTPVETETEVITEEPVTEPGNETPDTSQTGSNEEVVEDIPLETLESTVVVSSAEEVSTQEVSPQAASATITNMQLRSGSVDGTLVADNLHNNPSVTWQTDTLYYLVIEVTKNSTDDSWVSIDLPYWMVPGSMVGGSSWNVTGAAVEDTAIDKVVSFTPKTYNGTGLAGDGSSASEGNLGAGKVVYHIKENVSVAKIAVSMKPSLRYFNGSSTGQTVTAEKLVVACGDMSGAAAGATSSQKEITITKTSAIDADLYAHLYNSGTNPAYKPGAVTKNTAQVLNGRTSAEALALWTELEFDITWSKYVDGDPKISFAGTTFDASGAVENEDGSWTLHCKTTAPAGSSYYNALAVEAKYKSDTPNGTYSYVITNLKMKTYGDESSSTRLLDPKQNPYLLSVDILDSLDLKLSDWNVSRYDWYGQKQVSQNSLINAVRLVANGPSDLSTDSKTVTVVSPTNAIIREIVVPRYANSGSTISITAGGSIQTYNISEVSHISYTHDVNGYAVIRNTDLGLGQEVSIEGFTYEVGKIYGGSNTIAPYYDKYEVYDYYKLSLWGSFTNKTTATGTFSVYSTALGQDGDTAKQTKTTNGSPNPELVIAGQNTGEVSILFGEGGTANSTLTAGQSTLVKATYKPTSYTFYPDTTTVFDYEPTFYMFLPSGLQYKNFAINGTAVEGVALESANAAAAGLTLYQFASPEGTSIGYYGADGAKPTPINLTFELVTERSAKTETYDLAKILFVGNKDNKDAQSGNGSGSVAAEDLYNVNNGNKLRTWKENVALLNVREVKEVIIENSMSVVRDGKTETITYDANDAANTRALVDENATANYSVTITNRTGEEASNIDVFVPIPKTGKNYGAGFNPEGAFEFDSSFSIAAGSLPTGFSYEYIKLKTDKTYGVGQLPAAADYEETSDPAEADMIRIFATSMEKDAQVTITLAVELGSNLDASAGKVNVWSVAPSYTAGGTTVSPPGSPGAIEVANGVASGTVYHDLNGNGNMDGSEIGISGVTVTATDTFGKVLTTTTNTNGAYEFSSLRNTTGTSGTINKDTSITIVVANPNAEVYVFSPTKTTGTKPSVVSPALDQSSGSKEVSCVSNTAKIVDAGLRGSFTVTYAAGTGGAIGTPPSETVIAGESPVSVPSTTPDTNYQFNGWSIDVAVTASESIAVGSTTYAAGDTIPAGTLLTSEQVGKLIVAQSFTATANFALKTHTLYFDANGGTGGTASKTVTVTQAVGELPSTAAGTAPTQTGKTFAGWATTASATQANFTASTVWSEDADGTVYAVWSAIEYTISYENLKGASNSNPTTYNYNVANITLADPGNVRGYTFDGWTVALVSGQSDADLTITGNSGKSPVIDKQSYGNLVATASWIANSYIVDYNANGGTGTVGNQTVYYEQEWTTQANGFSRPGYTFVGWNTQQNGLGTSYDANKKYESYDETNGMTLYARWTANSGTPYKVEHYLVSASGTARLDTTENLTGTTAQTATASQRAYTGYTFAPSYSGTKTSGTIDGSGSLVLRLYYTQNTYTVTFVDYNDRVIAARTGVPYGGSALAPTDPTRIGHTFAGWDRGFSYITSNITVRATYTPLSYTITFVDYDDEEIQSTTATYGSAVTPPANPSRQGFRFTGWDQSSTVWTNVTADATIRAQYDDETTVTPPVTTTTTTTGGGGEETTVTSAQALARAAEEQGIPSIGVPLAAPDGFSAWALANLILVVLSFVAAIVFGVARKVRSKGEDDEREQNGGYERDDSPRKRSSFGWVIAMVLAAVAGLVLFVLTQDISLPLVWVDFWTILNAVLFIAVLILGNGAIHQKKEKKENAERNAATQNV